MSESVLNLQSMAFMKTQGRSVIAYSANAACRNITRITNFKVLNLTNHKRDGRSNLLPCLKGCNLIDFYTLSILVFLERYGTGTVLLHLSTTHTVKICSDLRPNILWIPFRKNWSAEFVQALRYGTETDELCDHVSE